MHNQNTIIDSIDIKPLGTIWVARSTQGLIALTVGNQQDCEMLIRKLTGREPVRAPRELRSITNQLAAYLHKERIVFDVIIDWSFMTPFQNLVLHEALTIPYGHTRTYRDLAQAINKPLAARAVGTALATNPLPLIIPCHRVLRSDGSLGGYSVKDGITTKSWLLKLESH